MKKEQREKREVELANKLAREKGHFNTYSAVQFLNDGKPKSKRITNAQLLLLLRKKGFLKLGRTTSTEDPDHNKPYPYIKEKGWAYPLPIPYIDYRKESPTYGRKKTDIFAIYTPEGIKQIERAVNDPDYDFWHLKKEAQKPIEQPTISEFEREKQRQANEAAHDKHMQQIIESLG